MMSDEDLFRSIALGGGVKFWNEWRINNSQVRPDLRRADLSDMDLSGVDLSFANLAGANLARANLREANATGADLNHARLTDAKLDNARLSEANLVSANLSDATATGADFSGANFSDARLTKINLSGAKLTGADLTGADLTSAALILTDLGRTDLTAARFRSVDIRGARLDGAKIEDTEFRSARGLDEVYHHYSAIIDRLYGGLSTSEAIKTRGVSRFTPVVFSLGWLSYELLRVFPKATAHLHAFLISPARAQDAKSAAGSFIPPLGLSQSLFDVMVFIFVLVMVGTIATLLWSGFIAKTKNAKAAAIVEHFGSFLLGAFFGTKI
jgi:uncharacterized protein YjbI with pentapeptide repeats